MNINNFSGKTFNIPVIFSPIIKTVHFVHTNNLAIDIYFVL